MLESQAPPAGDGEEHTNPGVKLSELRRRAKEEKDNKRTKKTKTRARAEPSPAHHQLPDEPPPDEWPPDDDDDDVVDGVTRASVFV